MYEDNKGLRILRRVYVCIFVVAAVVNAVLSGRLGFVNFIAICVWVYGVASYLGYIKHVESKEGDRIVYATSVPVLPIVVVRVAQLLLGKFLNVGMKDGNMISFFVCCFLDIVLIVLAVMDSGSYYYEGVVEQDVGDHNVVTVENRE